MRRLALLVVAASGVAGLVAAWRVPPAAPRVEQPAWEPGRAMAAGAYHVHSLRSDGTGTLDEIAAAAARAGLQFVIVTDHGDGTRPPEPPAYRAGVLVIDGVEISTSGGHYVALGLAAPAPYPLAGTPAAVIEDVRRLGGFGIAAHPDSPKAALRWDGWTLPFGGLEWLNADSEWRDELWTELGTLLLTYPFRPVEVLAGLIDRPSTTLAAWDRLARLRRVPGLAGADAHARLGYREETDAREERMRFAVPSYEASFEVFRNVVLLDQPLTGRADEDAAAVLDGLANGRVLTIIEGLARGGYAEFVGSSGARLARPGEYLDLAGTAVLEARVNAPPGASLTLLRDGEPIYDTTEPSLRVDVGAEPAAYRLEVRVAGASGPAAVPWLLTNPIYAGLRPVHDAARRAASPPPAARRTAVVTEAWTPESSAGSVSRLEAGALDAGTPAGEWHFTLAGGRPAGQYAALRFPLPNGLERHDRVQLRLRADRPMRLWVQLRARAEDRGTRWGLSFYADPTVRDYELLFADFAPMDGTGAQPLPADRIDALLLVVDTLNTRPGTSGRILLPDLWLAGR
ncbi:MAG: CehA/McbA family metallohydrolase [Acidobacteriota bacterium]